jgi:hypothetical protein
MSEPKMPMPFDLGKVTQIMLLREGYGGARVVLATGENL